MKMTETKKKKLVTALSRYLEDPRSDVVSHCMKHIEAGRMSYVVAVLESESDKIEQPLRGELEKLHILSDWLWFLRYKKYRRRVGLEKQ